MLKFVFRLLPTKKGFPILRNPMLKQSEIVMSVFLNNLETSDQTSRKDILGQWRNSQIFFSMLTKLFPYISAGLKGNSKIEGMTPRCLTTLLVLFESLLKYPAFVPYLFIVPSKYIFRPYNFLQFFQETRLFFFFSTRQLTTFLLIYCSYTLLTWTQRIEKPFEILFTNFYAKA